MSASVRLLEQTWKIAARCEALSIEMLWAEQQICRWRAVETEMALAFLVERHERQRGVRIVGAHYMIGGDAGVCQLLQQEIAEHVPAQHADERRRRTEPCHRHGHVGRCSAGMRT